MEPLKAVALTDEDPTAVAHTDAHPLTLSDTHAVALTDALQNQTPTTAVALSDAPQDPTSPTPAAPTDTHPLTPQPADTSPATMDRPLIFEARENRADYLNDALWTVQLERRVQLGADTPQPEVVKVDLEPVHSCLDSCRSDARN